MSESSLAVKMVRGLLMSTVLVPLILATNYFFPYIVPRTVFFRTVVELSFGIFIYLLVARDWRFRTHFDLFFWGLLAFVAASGISALFSPARNRAMFGDFERMGGVWGLLHYLMFYALVRLFFGERQWKLYANLSLAVCGGVSLIALYEGGGAQATIGNSGLLGLYLFFGVGLSVYLALQANKKWLRSLYALSGILNLAALVLSHNRSSMLGLVSAVIVATVIYFFLGKTHRKAIAILGTAVVLTFGVGLILASRAPESWVAKHLPTTFTRIAGSGLSTDASRTVLWTAAFEGFRDRPLVGYGPENYHLAWSANFQPRVYTVTTEQRVDRAHNIMLEVLSTTGLLGFITFLGMWAALLYSISSGLRKRELSLSEAAFFAAMSLGYLVSLSFWFIDINSFVPWIALSAFLAHRLSGGQVMVFDAKLGMDGRRKFVFGAAVVALGLSLWLHTFETLRVARLLYKTQTANSDVPVTLHAFFDVFDSPAPQTSHTPLLFGRYMGWVIPRVNSGNRNPMTRNLLDTAFARGLGAFEQERKRDPRNELIYLQQSRLALLAGAFYGLPIYYDYAVKSLREAVKLSPRRVQPKLVLGYTLMMGKRFEEARSQLDSARAIYPGSGQIYYYIGELHRLQGDFVGAGAALDTSFTLGYAGPPDVYFAVLGGLQALGHYKEAATLGEAYLRVTQTGYSPGGSDRVIVPGSPGMIPVLARLPWLWAKAGNNARALGAIRNFRATYPPGAERADAFVKALNSGDPSWQRDVSLLPSQKH